MKPVIAISCPIDTYSGYGARSRDIVKALLELDKYEVHIVSQRWGDTKSGFLSDHNESELLSHVLTTKLPQPDVWIQITVPNEFKKVGKYNIGITAGIETTVADAGWIKGCNEMDLVITSSKHSLNVFNDTVYEVEDTQEVIKVQTPMEVLFEGVDTNIYSPKKAKPFELDIPESFAFLFVGHWLQGDLYQDRKNVGYLIKTFLQTFANVKNAPALILKTQAANSSIIDRNNILRKVEKVKASVSGTHPNIYLIHGEVSDQEVNSLYNNHKVKAMVSYTRGEGFGRPLLEFTTTNKPVIASGWSGHTDFLSADKSVLIGGTLTDVHSSAAVDKMILTNSKWFTPDDAQASLALKEVFNNYKKYAERAKRQGYITRSTYTLKHMREQLDSILSKYLTQ